MTDSSNSAPFNPFILPNKYKCSFGVKFIHRQSNYGQIPTSLNIFGSFLSTSKPFNFTEPSVFGKSDVKTLKIVDFPALLGPRSPRISFYLTIKEISLIARTPLSNSFFKCNVEIAFSELFSLTSASSANTD